MIQNRPFNSKSCRKYDDWLDVHVVLALENPIQKMKRVIVQIGANCQGLLLTHKILCHHSPRLAEDALCMDSSPL